MRRISKVLVLLLAMSLIMGCLVSCKKEDAAGMYEIIEG